MSTIPLRPPGQGTLDARSIAHGASSKCERQRELLKRGVNLGEVAMEIYHRDIEDKQSKITLAVGNQFERAVLLQPAKVVSGKPNPDHPVVKLCVRKKLLAADDSVILDLRALHGDGGRGPRYSQKAVDATRAAIERRYKGKGGPAIILGAQLSLDPLRLPLGYVLPDVLIAPTDEPLYVPTELKSYEAREGLTAEEDTESAAAQASVSLAILWELLDGYRDLREVLLVMRRPASMRPTMHKVPAARDLDRILGFASYLDMPARARLSAVPTIKEIDAIPNAYRPECLQSCALSAVCRDKALQMSDPALLGRAAENLFRPLRTLSDLENLPKRGDFAVEHLKAVANAFAEVAK